MRMSERRPLQSFFRSATALEPRLSCMECGVLSAMAVLAARDISCSSVSQTRLDTGSSAARSLVPYLREGVVLWNEWFA